MMHDGALDPRLPDTHCCPDRPRLAGGAVELALSDEPDSLVLRYLRRIDERLERVEVRLQEVSGRLGLLEQQYALLSARVDRIELRLDRIERRLDLADTPA